MIDIMLTAEIPFSFIKVTSQNSEQSNMEMQTKQNH
jgi:hypothetical protein